MSCKLNKNIANKLDIVREMLWPEYLYVNEDFYKLREE